MLDWISYLAFTTSEMVMENTRNPNQLIHIAGMIEVYVQ